MNDRIQVDEVVFFAGAAIPYRSFTVTKPDRTIQIAEGVELLVYDY